MECSNFSRMWNVTNAQDCEIDLSPTQTKNNVSGVV